MHNVYAELKHNALVVIVAGDRMINSRSAHIIWLESSISCCKIYSVKQWSTLQPFVGYFIAGRYLSTEESILFDLFFDRTPDFSTERRNRLSMAYF